MKSNISFSIFPPFSYRNLMHNKSLKIHTIIHDDEFLTHFNFILQNGFRINAILGCTIYEFLSVQCYLQKEYIDSRISTIFLNGNPVDDIKKAIIEQNSVLSLSGAMPGLVGAVMRTGSFYASFRDSITYKKEDVKPGKETGFFTLKLFNILMQEIGSFFWEKGIFLSSSDFLYFLSIQMPNFRKGFKHLYVNQKSETTNFFEKKDFIEKYDSIFLKISLK